MSLNVWIKSNLADKALAPIRTDLRAEIKAGSSVLDVGCGTGDFIMGSASKIASGLGIDLDGSMIKFANKKRLEKNVHNVEFQCIDVFDLKGREFDVATSTLCLHEMRFIDACDVLKQMARVSQRVLIADYGQPKTTIARLGIEFDEMISGHYGQFRRYRKAGYILQYAKQCGLDIVNVTESKIDGIFIWEIKGELGE